ncbi:aldose 1-epimerase [Neocallimastix lanati (nom. inval.)]|jgi:aldose 1-epimerase|nr:aldose 1-epimerase [Neocallimastix sp. JGI-2020a]
MKFIQTILLLFVMVSYAIASGQKRKCYVKKGNNTKPVETPSTNFNSTTTVTKKFYGITKDGKEAHLYSIKNSHGTEVVVTEYAAAIVNLFVKNDKNEIKDIVLGYDTLKGYEEDARSFGATVGPNTNRIANAKFTIDGVEYQLVKNNGENNIHTDANKGFQKQFWNAEIVENGVRFSYEMPDLYVGIPGNVKIHVTYTLNDENELRIQYNGVSDKKTIFNPTNHSYFSLAGCDAGREGLFNTELMLKASKFTELDATSIPTGKLIDVAGTPMDFTTPKKIGKDIYADYEQMTMVKGYDHNFAVDDYDGTLRLIARAKNDGRTMEVYTDRPGFQFYTGNNLVSIKGKGGMVYEAFDGFCLEAQFFPNSVNEPSFVSPVKDAGEEFSSATVYKFL